MNVIKENQSRLNVLFTQYRRIRNTTYPSSYFSAKENMLKILEKMIEEKYRITIAPGQECIIPNLMERVRNG